MGAYYTRIFYFPENQLLKLGCVLYSSAYYSRDFTVNKKRQKKSKRERKKKTGSRQRNEKERGRQGKRKK